MHQVAIVPLPLQIHLIGSRIDFTPLFRSLCALAVSVIVTTGVHAVPTFVFTVDSMPQRACASTGTPQHSSTDR